MDNNKKLAESLLKADGINPIKPSEIEKAVFRKMVDEQLKTNIFMTVLRNKTVKFAVAALVIIMAFIGFSYFGGSLDTTSVALADVAAKISQIKSCVFKKTTTISSNHEINTFESLSYYTKGIIREDIYESEKIRNQVYVNYFEGNLVGINYKERYFRKTKLTDDDIGNQSMSLSPEEIANFILSKGEYKKLGKKTINGIASEGFEFDDMRTMLSMDKDYIKNMIMRFWVGVNTNLPIRVEVDCILINNSKANVVMYDPQYDVAFEPDFFEPQIPLDFINYEERGFVGLNLESWPTLKVVSGMPAEKAGIKDGDVLTKINGLDVSYIKTPEDARLALSGKAGDKISLTVKRQGSEYTFDIVRVPLPDKQ